MSLDLYQIGTNLIHRDGIAASLDSVIGRLADLQDINDHINPEFGGAHIAAADLASDATGIAGTWSPAADAAERFVTAGRAHLGPSLDIRGFSAVSNGVAAGGADDRSLELFKSLFGGNVNGVGMRTVAAANDQAAGADDLAWSIPYRDFVDADFAKGFDASRASQPALPVEQAPKIGHEHGFDVPGTGWRYSATDSGAFAARKDGFGFDEGTLARLLGHSQTGAWEIPSKAQDANGSEHRFGQMGAFDRDGIDAYAFQQSGKGASRGGWELDGITDATFGSVAQPRTSASSAADLAEHAISANDPVGLDDASGSGGVEKNRFSSVYGPPEHHAALFGFNDRGEQLNGIYAEPPDPGISFHNAVFDPGSMAFGLEPAAGRLPSGIRDADSYNPGNLTDFLRGLTPVAAEPKSGASDMLRGLDGVMERFDTLSGSGSATYAGDLNTAENDAGASVFGFGSVPMLQRLGVDHASTDSRDSQAARRVEEEGAARASGPPEWLVALTSAVVMELTRNARNDQAAPLGESLASRQGQVTPSGTRNDPLHVKVVGQAVAYGTHMPVGPTASLPSQSLPIPGQVSFSP